MTKDGGRATRVLSPATAAPATAISESRISPIVAEIASTLLPDYPHLASDERRGVERDVAAYVAGQIDSMPTFLRLPYRLALVAFDVLSMPLHGRRFRSLPRAARESYASSWNAAPLPPMRDFLKLIRSTALLVYFDHPVVRHRLRTPSPTDEAHQHAAGD